MNSDSTQRDPFLFQKAEGHAFVISGKDARRYLNNRLTQDIKNLHPGEFTLGAALTPQGRCEGVYTLICQQEGQFLVYCDNTSFDESITGLKRFLVSEQVIIEELNHHSLYHIAAPDLSVLLERVAPSPLNSEKNSVQIAADCFLIPRKRSSLSGIDILGTSEKVLSLLSQLGCDKIPELSDELQIVERIKGGLPEYPTEILPARIFSEFGLEEAISFRKGCYPGQEVIERADARGKLPKRLIRLRLDCIAKIDLHEKILDEQSKVVGETLSSASDPAEQATYAFALIANRPELTEASNFTIAGVPAKALSRKPYSP